MLIIIKFSYFRSCALLITRAHTKQPAKVILFYEISKKNSKKISFLYSSKSFYCIFLANFLCIWKNSSTFAPEFEIQGKSYTTSSL